MVVIAIVLLVVFRIPLWAAAGNLGRQVGAEMGTIAARMLEGYGYASPYGPARNEPTTVEPPLFVWLTAGVFYVFGIKSTASFLVIQGLNIALQCLTLILMLRIIRATLSPAACPIFAVLFAVHPLLVFLAANTWENCLTSLLLTLIAYDVILRWRPGMSYLRLGLSGMLLGVTSLSNSGWTPGLIALCLAGLYWNVGLRGWRILPRLAVILVGLGVVTAPWTARNYVAMGRFIFVRGMVGPELYKGNNPEALGGHGVGFSKRFLVESETEVARLLELGETAYDDMTRRIAYEEIRTRPLAFVGRCIARVGMWWFGDFDLVLNHAQAGRTKHVVLSVVSMLACTAATIAATLGWLLARKNAHTIWVLTLYCLLLPVPYYFIVVGFRFRATLSPFILAFAAYWCAERLAQWAAGYNEVVTVQPSG